VYAPRSRRRTSRRQAQSREPVNKVNNLHVLKHLYMKKYIFWDVPLCNPVELHRHFGGTYFLHLWGQRLSQARNQQEAGGK
jgi:hypothetical protein